MKVTIKVKKEVEIKMLKIRAGVRYWEDATVNGIEDEKGELIPCRVGDNWCPVIDIESGIIRNWEIGKKADVHFKVCDDGDYWLCDGNGDELLHKDGYVPDMLDLDGESYGDYIILNIDENGKIEGWDNDPNVSDFETI